MEKIEFFIKELQNSQMLEPEVGWASYAGIHQNEGTETYECKLETMYNGFTEEFMEIFLKTALDDRMHLCNYVIERLKRCDDKVFLIMPPSPAIEQLQREAETATYPEDKKRYFREAEKLTFFRDMILLQSNYADKAKEFVQKCCCPEPDVNAVKPLAKGETMMPNFLHIKSYTPTIPFDMSGLYAFLIGESVIKDIDVQLFGDCITHAHMNEVWEVGNHHKLKCVFRHLKDHFPKDWIENVAQRMSTTRKRITAIDRSKIRAFELKLTDIL